MWCASSKLFTERLAVNGYSEQVGGKVQLGVGIIIEIHQFQCKLFVIAHLERDRTVSKRTTLAGQTGQLFTLSIIVYKGISSPLLVGRPLRHGHGDGAITVSGFRAVDIRTTGFVQRAIDSAVPRQ